MLLSSSHILSYYFYIIEPLRLKYGILNLILITACDCYVHTVFVHETFITTSNCVALENMFPH